MIIFKRFPCDSIRCRHAADAQRRDQRQCFPMPVRNLGDEAVTDRRAAKAIWFDLATPLISEELWARQMEAEVRERFNISVDLSDFGSKWFTERAPTRSSSST